MATVRRCCTGIAVHVSLTSAAPLFPPPPLPLPDDEISDPIDSRREATTVADFEIGGDNSVGAWIDDVTDMTWHAAGRVTKPVFRAASSAIATAQNHTYRAINSARDMASKVVILQMCPTLWAKVRSSAVAAAVRASPKLLNQSAPQDIESCAGNLSESLNVDLLNFTSHAWALVDPDALDRAVRNGATTSVDNHTWALVDVSAVQAPPEDRYPLVTGWALKSVSHLASMRVCGEFLRLDHNTSIENSSTSKSSRSSSSDSTVDSLIGLRNTADNTSFTRVEGKSAREHAVVTILVHALVDGVDGLCTSASNSTQDAGFFFA